MMPGETHSKTAGLATEGTVLACQNCSVLQQNLNEYVDALVALKQKIIETDHLLSKYQQKCDELQRTERENGTLRHQLEQMLQKMATHDHCQREIQSLQEELEEKKSSVKIYQNIQEEYVRIKEECDQSIVGKKKLEGRVKKLEDAVAKHNSDVKQLKMEKKVMEKELKKAQEKLDRAEKQHIRKKKMKHAVTQFTAEEPVLKVDKNKIKCLLEELWVCFDAATQEQKNKDIESMLAVPVSEKVARKRRKSQRSADYLSPPSHSSLLESSSMLMEKGKDSEEATCNKRNKVFEEGQDGGDSAFYEERSNDVLVQKSFACSSIHCSDQDDDEDFGVKLHHVLNWARPLPPLLSPVQLSPSCTQNTLFGEVTDSSDEEVDCSTSNREPLSDDATFESQLNCTFVGRQENYNKETTSEVFTVKEMEQEIATNKEKHAASRMFGNAGKKKKMKTATLTSSLSEYLESSENASRKPMETEETLEQIHTIHPEHTSEMDEELELLETPKLNNDQIRVETTEIRLRTSEPCQIKTNEQLPLQEKIVATENTATDNEHLQERIIKIGLPVDTCANTEDSICLLQFGASSSGVHDSLTTHENSQVTDNVKNIVSMNPNLEAIKSRPVPNEETACVVPKHVEESSFKTRVAGLCTDNSLMDYEKDASGTNAVVHLKLPSVTAETECKLVNLVGRGGRSHLEHSYSCMVPECSNVAKLQSCQCKVTSGKVIDHVSPKAGRENISMKVTETKVQHLCTISVKGMEGNEQNEANGQNLSKTTKSVTPIISAKQAASKSDKPGENSTNHSANSNSPNKQFGNFETNLEKISTEELKVSCTSASHIDITQTVKVDSNVLHPAVLTKQTKHTDENKEETDSKTFFVNVESERECAENILLLSKVNLHMDELSQTRNDISSKCLPEGSSLTSKYETQVVGKSLQAEVRTEPELKSPIRRRSKKQDLKSLPPKKATDFAPFVVEPEHPSVEISNHMQLEKAYVVSEQKAGVSNSTGVKVTSKPASLLLNSNREVVPEQHERKANVKVVLCTDVTKDVDPLEHSKIITSSGTESSLNDVADKLGDNNEEMFMESCNIDKCKGSVTSNRDPELCVIIDNEVVDHLSKCDNKFVPFMDHEAIAKQFLVESSDFVKKTHSSNTMFDSDQTSKSAVNAVSCSVEKIVDHLTSQQSKPFVISEMDSSDKHEACHEAGESDKGIFNLPVQQTEEEVVVNSVEIKQPCCLTVAGQRDEVKTANPTTRLKVIHEMHRSLKRHEFVSVDSTNYMPLENSSISSFESVNDHFITDHTCLDFCVLSRCSGVAVSQNRIGVTDLFESDCSVALESINAFLENSEKVKNGMKEFCPEKFTQIKLPANVSSFRNANEQPEKKVQGNARLSSTFKNVRYVEDSDLEEEFPVRRVRNRKHKNYRKPVENNDLHDVAKLTEMMKCITTAKVYKACKNPSLSSDELYKARHFKTHFPASISASEMSVPNVNALLHTTVLTKLSESNAEAAPKEVVGVSKCIDQKKCNLVLSGDAKELALGSSARHSKKDRNSDTDSVPDDMAHNAHRMNELAVGRCEAAVDLTMADQVKLVKTGAKDSTSKEKPEESHEAPSEDANISSVSQQYDENVLDLSLTKMQQRSSSPVGECSLEITPSVKTNEKKPRLGKNCIWKIPILDSNPFATRKSLRPHSSGVSNVNVKSLNYKAQQISNNSVKTVSEVPNSKLQIRVMRVRGKVKSPHTANLPIVANADTSTTTKHSPETISKVRSEMGPPLPPLLQPLIATPPRSLRPLSPIMSTSSQSSLPSPLDDLISPLRETPVAALVSPLSDDQRHKSQFTTPSPSETPTKRIVSSPLQFCAATPKHALPVPGRLPLSASGNVPPTRPQENSVRILDSMYPELSAQARTLNILKGNIQLSRCPPTDSKNLPGPVSQITGFKTIASTSTAFVKTVKSSKSDSNAVSQKDIQGNQSSVPSLASTGKRAIMICAMPRSAKRLCLGNESPNTDIKEGDETVSKKDLNVIKPVCDLDVQEESFDKIDTELPCHVQNRSDPNEEDINNALKKIGDSCFDLLPVIHSHVQVGNIPRVPVMRDQEKEVIHDCTVDKKVLAEPLLHTIAKKLKDEMMSLDKNYLQALCRVYVGICRQLGDLERARLFCYSLLKEDFPESDKLALFVLSVWQEAFTQPGVVNKAIQSLVKQRAKGEIQTCLTAYFKWDKGSPLTVSVVLSSVLMAIELCPNMKFQTNEQFGEDLSHGIWEYVFAIDLLCSYRKWAWTHDNVISKDLWPIMDKWVKHRKGHLNVISTPDIIVAAVLRLIGRLSQIGLKEGFISAVKNISSVICSFIQHAKEEDMPWGVQLASVYALCDMASSDPAGIFKTLQTWRTATSNNIPPEVNRKIADISLLCMQLD